MKQTFSDPELTIQRGDSVRWWQVPLLALGVLLLLCWAAATERDEEWPL